MIYTRTCKICGEVLKVNGEINMQFSQTKHLQDKHPDVQLELSNLRYKISEAAREVKNFENTIWR